MNFVGVCYRLVWTILSFPFYFSHIIDPSLVFLLGGWVAWNFFFVLQSNWPIVLHGYSSTRCCLVIGYALVLLRMGSLAYIHVKFAQGSNRPIVDLKPTCRRWTLESLRVHWKVANAWRRHYMYMLKDWVNRASAHKLAGHCMLAQKRVNKHRRVHALAMAATSGPYRPPKQTKS